MQPEKNFDYKLISATSLFGGLFAILLICNFWLAKDSNSVMINLLIIVFGSSVGWIFGIFSSPYTTTESSKFNSFVKAVGAFFSGYILAKMDGLIAHMLNPEFLFVFDNGFRTISFAVAAILIFLITYIYRTYAPNSRLPNNPTDVA